MNRPRQRILMLQSEDSVALALSDLAPGDPVGAGGIAARDVVPFGHKIAVRFVSAGQPVFKYGQIIGIATQDIQAGAHVHVHNLSADAMADADLAAAVSAKQLPRETVTFEGYRRPGGRFGTRNYIGVLTSVNCSATVARKVAASFPDDMFDDDPHVDGVVAITHTTGCGMSGTGEAMQILSRTLTGYMRHVNFAGIVLIGLGCEVAQTDRLIADAGLTPSDTVRIMTIQREGGTLPAIEAGKRHVRDLVEVARASRRETVSAEHLTLGLQCGASDGWSGVTANPALGRAADRLVASGGTVILSETPEIYGAEQLLYARAASATVRDALKARLDWWDAYVRQHGQEMNNNPSPGNKKGGLTTILEKSLGAVAKSGTSPLMGVFGFGESVTRKGFVFMDSPGYDPCSATGQMASGANLLSFTTGRGSVYGSKPAPCLKLASNARLAAAMPEDMDVDCSPVLDGVSLEGMGDQIFDRLIALASGEKSQSEVLGFGDLEFVPWQLGAVM